LQALQRRSSSLPNDLLDRLQAVIDATVLIQQPWDEGRSVRFDCQSLIPGLSCRLAIAESEAEQRYSNDFLKQYWFLSGFLTALLIYYVILPHLHVSLNELGE